MLIEPYLGGHLWLESEEARDLVPMVDEIVTSLVFDPHLDCWRGDALARLHA